MQLVGVAGSVVSFEFYGDYSFCNWCENRTPTAGSRNRKLAAQWLARVYVEPLVTAPELNEVAFVGYAVMRGQQRSKTR